MSKLQLPLTCHVPRNHSPHHHVVLVGTYNINNSRDPRWKGRVSCRVVQGRSDASCTHYLWVLSSRFSPLSCKNHSTSLPQQCEQRSKGSLDKFPVVRCWAARWLFAYYCSSRELTLVTRLGTIWILDLYIRQVFRTLFKLRIATGMSCHLHPWGKLYI
jgi:hypothetical protein